MSITLAQPPSARLFEFVGGNEGPWRIDRIVGVTGPTLAAAARLSMTTPSAGASAAGAAWRLSGITSNERYVTRTEKSALVERQEGLGRPASTLAALIPIRKSPAWWALTQDERRDVLETRSQHIAIGLRYLPAIARRLHHCRDLGADPAFDFLTWFEFGPADCDAFDDLLHALRASPEWGYVEREVDVRLTRLAS